MLNGRSSAESRTRPKAAFRACQAPPSPVACSGPCCASGTAWNSAAEPRMPIVRRGLPARGLVCGQSRGHALFVRNRYVRGRGSGWVPQRGRLFKLDFPSAKFWVKMFFGWVGLRAKRPLRHPPINKAWLGLELGRPGEDRGKPPPLVHNHTSVVQVHHGGDATLRVLGRQLPASSPSPHPPSGTSGQQSVVRGAGLRTPWVPKASNAPRAPKVPNGIFVHFAPQTL